MKTDVATRPRALHSDANKLDTRSWRGESFAFPDHVPTMVSTEEKQYLFWLGAKQWSGAGTVVEIGPWLGGSTVCLADGMRQSTHSCDKKLIVYDNFLWRDFMAERCKLDLRLGESFMKQFEQMTDEYADVIDAYQRALPDEVIEDDVIADSRQGRGASAATGGEAEVQVFDGLPGEDFVEILFVDGAKSWNGMRHLLNTLSMRLRPGSLLVCQDFKYWGNYWVPLMIGLLSDKVEGVHNVLAATTTTFRLVDSLDSKYLDSLPMHVRELPVDKCVDALDHAASLLRCNGDLQGAAHVELGRTMLYVHHSLNDRAIDNFRNSQTHWSPNWKTVQLERARDYLAEQTGLRVPEPPTMKLRTAIFGQARRLKHLLNRIRLGQRSR